MLSLWVILTCLQTWFFHRVYEALIEEIDRENGTAAVTFSGYGNAEVIPLQNLKPVDQEGKRSEKDGGIKPKSKYAQNTPNILYSLSNGLNVLHVYIRKI